jgi:hypothetical protein
MVIEKSFPCQKKSRNVAGAGSNARPSELNAFRRLNLISHPGLQHRPDFGFNPNAIDTFSTSGLTQNQS